MSSSPNTAPAPWQLAPVNSASRVVAAALIFLAVDSTFAWKAIPVAASVAFVVLPLLVAIRVIRGFPNALGDASATLASYALLMVAELTSPVGPGASVVRAAVLVGAALSVAGLAASAIAWRIGRTPVIEIEMTESGSFVAVGSRTSP